MPLSFYFVGKSMKIASFNVLSLRRKKIGFVGGEGGNETNFMENIKKKGAMILKQNSFALLLQNDIKF